MWWPGTLNQSINSNYAENTFFMTTSVICFLRFAAHMDSFALDVYYGCVNVGQKAFSVATESFSVISNLNMGLHVKTHGPLRCSDTFERN